MSFLCAPALKGIKVAAEGGAGPKTRPVSKRGALLGWGRTAAHLDRIVVEDVMGGLVGVSDVSNRVWWVGVTDGMAGEGPGPLAVGALSGLAGGPSAYHHHTHKQKEPRSQAEGTTLTSGRNRPERYLSSTAA